MWFLKPKDSFSSRKRNQISNFEATNKQIYQNIFFFKQKKHANSERVQNTGGDLTLRFKLRGNDLEGSTLKRYMGPGIVFLDVLKTNDAKIAASIDTVQAVA